MSLPDKVRVMTLQEVFRTKKRSCVNFVMELIPGYFSLKTLFDGLNKNVNMEKHGDAGHICLEICFD